jgi:hypothetical protein
MRSPRPIDARALEPYKVWLRFTDGSEGVVDLVHLAGKGVFKAWDEPGFFARAFVSDESGTLTWPGELDICPDVLYSMVTGKPLPGEQTRVA